MDRDSFYPRDSIAAAATPWGESALAVVRVSGEDSLSLLDAIFEPAAAALKRASLRELPGHTLHRGLIRTRRAGGEPGERETIDDVLVAVYRGPRSYTGEDSAEIFSHGSPAIMRRLLALLQETGFRFAGPGEFTLRAFLNRKLDLTQAEAVNEIVRAKTDRARAIALNRLSGAIESRINLIKQGIVALAAAVEVRLDYPEEELDQAELEAASGQAGRWQGELEKLLATYRIGRIFQEGLAVVLAGRTNSGKSTLFNRLLKEDRAIVSEVHGTTRDYLEGIVSIEGIPVKLYDTAGFRDSGQSIDGIELEGLRRTDSIIGNAQVILYLVDAAAGLSRGDEEFLRANAADDRLIRVWNKCDLAVAGAPGRPEGFLAVSAREGEGLQELSLAITGKAMSGLGLVDTGEPIIDSLRQKQLLERALEALLSFSQGLKQNQHFDLLAVELKEALDALGEITGEVTSQDILNSIFSRFCVGK